MKKIYFHALSFKENPIEGLLMITGLVIIIFKLEIDFGAYSDYHFLVKLFLALPSLIFLYIFSKIFWYKNIIQRNKKGMNIKINRRWSKNIRFDELKNFEITGNQLILFKKTGENEEFTLDNIEQESIEILSEVLKLNIG